MLRAAGAARLSRAALRRLAAQPPPRARPAACAAAASSQPPAAATALRFLAPTRRATVALAQLLADTSAAGDVLCLRGAVGAGKSFFCRAFVRAVAEDALLPVPSPTFMLLQAYEEHAGPPVHHYDLYRLKGPEDMRNLELADSFSRAVSLVEWPERLGPLVPSARMDVSIADADAAALASAQAAAAEEDEEDDDGSGDTRPRAVTLQPHGARAAAAAAAVGAFVRRPPPEMLADLGGLTLLL